MHRGKVYLDAHMMWAQLPRELLQFFHRIYYVSFYLPFILCFAVGNIPYEATEDQLREVFSEVGPVVSFR